MKNRVILALPLVALLGVAFARTSPAADPPVSSAEVAALPSRSIADWIPPEERSEKPTPKEWAHATSLALVRSHPWCTASAVREWLRVSCADVNRHYKGVRVIGGSEKDVTILDSTLEQEKEKEKTDVLHVIFPVRRGDRRILTINSWEWGGYKSFTLYEELTTAISALWLPGDRGPTITVHGATFKGEQED